MKMTHLAIDEYGVCRDLHFGRFDDRLNLIFGATGSGKTTLRHFIRGVLFGFDDRNSYAGPGHRSAGQMEVVSSNHHFRLQRGLDRNADLDWTPMSSHSVSPSLLPTEDFLRVGAALYDCLLNVSFHDTRENMRLAAGPLQTVLGLPIGAIKKEDEFALAEWTQRRTQLRHELAGVEKRIEEVSVQRIEAQRRLDGSDSERRSQLASIDNEIASVDSELKGLQPAILQTRINLLQAESDNLRQLLADQENRVEPSEPAWGLEVSLYRCLDELDIQARQWRRFQSAIQERRVELRNQMLIWNELTSESTDHPYYKAQILLRSLEAQVDQAEQKATLARTESSEHPAGFNPIVEQCRQMRTDISGLCRELGDQFKHVRHGAGVAELKRLRERFGMISEALAALDDRRNQLVTEIRRLDPAGAAAILAAESPFMEYACKEGFFKARQRFVSTSNRTPASFPTVDRNELSEATENLRLVELELGTLLSSVSTQQLQRIRLESRMTELVGQREQVLNLLPHNRSVVELNSLDNELGRLRERSGRLQLEIDSSPTAVEQGHPFLGRVATLVGQLTDGELVSAWLSDDRGQWMVQTGSQITIPFSQLSRGQMDQVYLGVCLATAEHLAQQSVEMTSILDDVFANLDPVCARRAIEVLRASADLGLQLIVLAKHNEISLSDVRPSTVFELPQTSVSPIVFPGSGREPYAPPRQSWSNAPFSNHNIAPMDLASIPQVPLRPINSFLEGAETRYPWTGARPTGADRESGEILLTESGPLSDLKFFDLVSLRTLASCRIATIGQLLELNPQNLPDDLVRAGVQNEQLNRWQALAWLMVCVPGLRSVDAKLLYACGVTEPEQLDTTTSPQLLARLHRYLASSDGSRFASAGTDFDTNRLNRWYASLDKTRHQWRTGNGYSRRARHQQAEAEYDHFDSPVERPSFEEPQLGLFGARQKQTQNGKKRSIVGREPTLSGVTTNRGEHAATKRETREQGEQVFKFYLSLEDDLEAAPSIGPKTAERFLKIGVESVSDFLQQTAESMAEKLAYKRISASVVQQWQQQTRLVCRIPNLRGHDAQLLVACGFVEPEDVAAMDPVQLFSVIGPFAESKEGLKIVRSSKKPDLEEVENWVDWARHTRSLQAA